MTLTRIHACNMPCPCHHNLPSYLVLSRRELFSHLSDIVLLTVRSHVLYSNLLHLHNVLVHAFCSAIFSKVIILQLHIWCECLWYHFTKSAQMSGVRLLWHLICIYYVEEYELWYWCRLWMSVQLLYKILFLRHQLQNIVVSWIFEVCAW